MSTAAYTLQRIDRQSPESDFRQIAQLHQEEIRNGFLTSLGEDFLMRLYRSLAEDKNVFTVAARRDKEIIGYLCAAISTAGVYRRFLWRNAWRLAPALLPRLVSISTLRRVSETLLYPAKTAMSNLPEPEILNFCVKSSAQRCGVGRGLFQTLCDEFTRRGLQQLRIVTGQSQVSAQRFYESLGAVRVGSIEVHNSVPSLVYVYTLTGTAKSAA